MGQLARNAFNKKYGMPDYKIMGTINPKIGTKLNKLVNTGDKTDIIEIIDHINTILGVRISDISADNFPEPFTGRPKISQDYENPIGVLFLASNGSADLVVGNNKVSLQQNKIIFVNERNSYYIEKTNNTNLIMLSARFTWDPERHGT